MGDGIGISVGELITQFGIGGLIFLAFMFLLRWVLKTQEKILIDARDERQSWQTIISTHQTNLTSLNNAQREIISQMSEAHRYQRDEHKEMIDNLKGICMTVKEIQDLTQNSCQILTEHGKTLARINGYKQNTQ